MNDPSNREKFVSQGMIITTMNGKEFTEFSLAELVKWSKLVKDSGARVD